MAGYNPHPIDNGMTSDDTIRRGRPKGSPNKSTREIREALQYIVEKQLDKLEEAFNKVYEQDPGRFLSLYERFCNFVLPKQQQVEITSEEGISFKDSLKQTIENAEKVKNE